MAALRAVQVLCRDAASAQAVSALLQALLPCSTSDAGVIRAACGTDVQIREVPSSSRVDWCDAPDRPPTKLALSSVRLAALANGADVTAHSVPPPDASLSQMLMRLWKGQRVHAELSVEDSAAPAGDADVPAGGIKEVYLAASAAATYEHYERILSTAGARRVQHAPNVWSLHRGSRVRLSPGRYSALIFHSTQPLEQQREKLMSALHDSGLQSDAATVARVDMYGMRRGFPDAGQLRISSPALHGLDIRYCAQTKVSPLFNEAPEAMSDDVDPHLNPEAGDPRGAIPLACNSVVGMEVVSAAQRRWRLA